VNGAVDGPTPLTARTTATRGTSASAENRWGEHFGLHRIQTTRARYERVPTPAQIRRDLATQVGARRRRSRAEASAEAGADLDEPTAHTGDGRPRPNGPRASSYPIGRRRGSDNEGLNLSSFGPRAGGRAAGAVVLGSSSIRPLPRPVVRRRLVKKARHRSARRSRRRVRLAAGCDSRERAEHRRVGLRLPRSDATVRAAIDACKTPASRSSLDGQALLHLEGNDGITFQGGSSEGGIPRPETRTQRSAPPAPTGRSTCAAPAGSPPAEKTSSSTASLHTTTLGASLSPSGAADHHQRLLRDQRLRRRPHDQELPTFVAARTLLGLLRPGDVQATSTARTTPSRIGRHDVTTARTGWVRGGTPYKWGARLQANWRVPTTRTRIAVHVLVRTRMSRLRLGSTAAGAGDRKRLQKGPQATDARLQGCALPYRPGRATTSSSAARLLRPERERKPYRLVRWRDMNRKRSDATLTSRSSRRAGGRLRASRGGRQ